MKTRYFSRIKINNVRTFAPESELNLFFPDGTLAQWTVLLGENGTGKTTLLQYIASLKPEGANVIENASLAKDEMAVPRLSPLAVGPNWFSWHASNMPRPWSRVSQGLAVAVDLTPPVNTLSEVENLRAPFRLDSYVEGGPFEYGYKLEFGNADDGKATISANYTIPKDSNFHDEFFLIGYGATRHVAGPTSLYLANSNANNLFGAPLNTIFNEDQPLLSPETWLLGLDHAEKSSESDSGIKRILDRALACLSHILPEVDEILIKPFQIIESSPQNPVKLLFKTPYGIVPFESLSLGYRAMAAWVIDLFRRMSQRYPDLNNPATGAAVVLVDEFDLHMHPHWQMHAMDHLGREFPNTQFIVTAHSPLIVQAAGGKANLALLRKMKYENAERVYIENEPIQIKGWRLDQIVTSDLFNLPSSRPKEYEELIKKRIELLKKDSLSDVESTELALLTQKLENEAPPGISPTSLWLGQQLRSVAEKSGRYDKAG